MFVVVAPQNSEPSSVGAAWRPPPGAPVLVQAHAAPTELSGLCGRCSYKRGAPNGAFRAAAALPRGIGDPCKEERGGEETGARTSSWAMWTGRISRRPYGGVGAWTAGKSRSSSRKRWKARRGSIISGSRA